MRRLLLVLLLAAGGGGWFVFQKYRIDGLDRLALKPRDAAATNVAGSNSSGDGLPPVQRQSSAIRIASFEIQRFDSNKLANPRTAKTLVEVFRRFDVTAVQGIVTPRDDLMPQLIEQLNATGRRFDYVIGPRFGREATADQLAFVFDTASVEIDRSTMYTIEDPGRLLRRDPLVATFRVRGPEPKDAFTFTLVNVRVDAEHAGEIDSLAGVYRAVRSNGFDEDDVIVLGDLNTDDRRLGLLGQLPNMTTALSSMATNTAGTRMLDNILFNRAATTEYTGRSGVVDLAREFNLTTPQAFEVSDHLPVWAEFSIYENGQLGRLASPQRAGGEIQK